MKWKDSDEQARLAGATPKNYLDEEDNPRWNTEDKSGHLARIRMQLRRYSPILIGVAMFLGVVGLLKILFSGGGGVDGNRLIALEQRLQSLEEKYEKFDSIDDKVTRIWEQAQSYESFKERFDRTEASMILRMDHLATSIDAVHKRLSGADAPGAVARPVQATRSKTVEKSSSGSSAAKYHTVAPKETLYGISLKYDVELESLLEMNRLKKDTVIQPGQKVLVKR